MNTTKTVDTNGWSKHQIYVMHKLEDLTVMNKEQNSRLCTIENGIAMQNTSLAVQGTKIKYMAAGAATLVSIVMTTVVNLVLFLVKRGG